MVRCPHCGSHSTDPEWCSVCGSDLGGPTTVPRLAHGDQLAFELPATRTQPASFVAITLSERTAELTTRHIWMAQDADGRYYRVEEFDGTDDDDPDAVPVFAELVDVPVALTRYNDRVVRIYRHVDGTLLAQRLSDEGPLDAEGVLRWMQPLLDAIETIHAAGFVSLKICPYTVKYRGDGTIYLQNTGGLYRSDLIPSSLPAITGYTAPEIYSSDFQQPPGAAADIFSLAMVVYYLMTRRDPPVSMYSNWLPAVQARDLVPDFPPGMQPLLTFAGASQPNDRPADVAEFRALLVDCVARIQQRRTVSPQLRFTAACETHPGIFKRVHHPVNQDHVFSAVRPDHQLALVAVADGVSTASFGSGDLASSLAARRIQEAWKDLLAQPGDLEQQGPAQYLTSLMQSINYDIVAWVNERFTPFTGEPSEVMGTTCVLLLAWKGVCTIASLGDSRAYLIRQEFMELITRDHNLTTLGLVEGVDADTALMLPQGDALARCLGLFDTMPDRTLRPQKLQPDIYQFNLVPGDRILLCTDGLTDYAGPSAASAELAIFDTVLRERQPEVALLDLVALANRGGGGDNIGVAMLAAETQPLSLVRWLESRRAGETVVVDSDDL